MQQSDQQTDPLVRHVARHIDAHRLIAPGQTVLAGVSGGADSVAMLSILRELSVAPARAYRLTVVHLDHALRPDSGADAAWVGDLAAAWSLPMAVRRFPVAKYAHRRGQGIEEAARAARLAFFGDQSTRTRAACVAVGHHADDNVETVLYRIIRGTHIQGLGGMAPSRPLTEACQLIRPMLNCTRSEIQAYCRRVGLPWRTDATNAETAYRRNFIRHELLPLLREKLNPRVDQALGRLAAAACEVSAVLADLGTDALDKALCQEQPGRLELDASALGRSGAAVTAAAIRLALVRLGVPLRQIGADRMVDLAAALSCPGAAVPLPGGFEARSRGGRFILQRRPVGTDGPCDDWQVSVRTDVTDPTDLPDGRQVRCRIQPNDPHAFAEHCRQRPAGTELLDADTTGPVLYCGPRRKGERFHPLGAPGRQTVGDFLTNLRMPPALRRSVLCLRDTRGIVYLAPLRIDDRVKITPATRRVLRISIVDPGQKFSISP